MATEPRLPQAVRNQVAAADQIQAALDAAQASAPPPSDPFAQVLSAPAPVAAPAPTSAPAPTAPAAPAPAPAPAATAPVGLSQEELRSIIETNRRVTEFITQPPTPQPRQAPAPIAPPSIAPTPYKAETSDEEKRVFGDDVLNMVHGKIASALAPIYDSIRKIEQRFGSVSQEVQSVAQTSSMTAEQLLVQYIDKEVPDWRAVNVDKSFLTWVAQPDAMSGRVRQELLDSAVQTNDGVRIANIFKAYKSTLPPAPAPAQQDNSLESMVAPTTVAAEAPAPAAPAPIFTSAQVQFFHNEVAKGRYRGKEAEADRISKAIDEAAASGRISR